MKLTKEYFEAREAAMKWLSREPGRRSYDEGVRILTRSGYKSNVASLLSRKGELGWTMEKLSLCLRELIQVYYDPSDPRFDNKVADVDDLNDRSGKTVSAKETDMVMKESVKPEKMRQMPEVIQAVTRAFADAFKQRAKLHRRRAALDESNDASVKKERARLSAEMDALTEYMDALWPLREAYDKQGVIPSKEQLAAIGKRKGAKSKGQGAKDMEQEAGNTNRASLDGVSTDKLKTRRKSVVTMLTRKRNMLVYQQDTKGEKENPMPECPKRVKIERQMTELTDELTRIDYELAKRD